MWLPNRLRKDTSLTSGRLFTASPPPRRWVAKSFVTDTKHSWRRSCRRCGSHSANTMRLEDEQHKPSLLKYIYVLILCRIVCLVSYNLSQMYAVDCNNLFSVSFQSPKISSVPSGPLRCCLSWCVSSTCCPVCCSSSAWPPSPWYVTVPWAWPWWPCWCGPSSATLDGTAASAEPSTRPQASSWNRCVLFGRWQTEVC